MSGYHVTQIGVFMAFTGFILALLGWRSMERQHQTRMQSDLEALRLLAGRDPKTGEPLPPIRLDAPREIGTGVLQFPEATTKAEGIQYGDSPPINQAAEILPGPIEAHKEPKP